MKYCPQCRARLRSEIVGGTERFACTSRACQFVHWNNPTPVVAGLVESEGTFILGRNANWPAGLFSMFTGFLEIGESPEQGVIREIQEELGLETTHTAFIGHFPLPQLRQLVIAYALEARGNLVLNGEIAEIRRVTAEELAAFDFGPLALTREVVGQWRRRMKGWS